MCLICLFSSKLSMNFQHQVRHFDLKVLTHNHLPRNGCLNLLSLCDMAVPPS